MGARSRGTGAGDGRRRVVTVLVALSLAGSTGTATALAVPGLTRADGPTPAPVAIIAPVPALGPLAATAPSATATGVGAVLDPLASARGLGEFTGSVTDPSCGTAPPAPRWFRAAPRSSSPRLPRC